MKGPYHYQRTERLAAEHVILRACRTIAASAVAEVGGGRAYKAVAF
jgi:hypothetical protein